jgi:hypothetical protein
MLPPPDPQELTLIYIGGHRRTISGLGPGQAQQIIGKLAGGEVALVHAPISEDGPKHTWLFPDQLICIEAPMTEPDTYAPGSTQ